MTTSAAVRPARAPGARSPEPRGPDSTEIPSSVAMPSAGPSERRDADSIEATHGEAKRGADLARARDADYIYGLQEMQHAAAVALTVLRRALVEGVPVTREAITHEASVVFAADPDEAVVRLDSQAQGLGISSLM
jgi:hypothetical protein